jgi:hypothetical protein
MGHPLRWNRTDLVYEVTLSTIQGRYLLRPSREVRDLILGIIGKAQTRYPAISLYAFMFSRDEATLLLASSDEQQFARFMAYVAGGISRKLGRLLDWSGKLWAGRYRAVPILDEEAINERLRFVLSRGVAEDLVTSPKDWPGATCVPGLLGSMTMEGTWVDRDAEASLRAAGLDPPPSSYVQPYRVTLTPIPAWADLEPSELVGRYRTMIDSIEYEHLVRNRGEVMDPVVLQQQDPFFRPTARPRGRRLAALCHASSTSVKEAFRTAYRCFCAAFRAAAGAVAQRTATARALVAGYPQGSNPRPELRVPWRPEQGGPSIEDPSLAVDTVRDESHGRLFEIEPIDQRASPPLDAVEAVRVPLAAPLPRHGRPTTAGEPRAVFGLRALPVERRPGRSLVETDQVTQVFTRPRAPPSP